MLNCASRNLSYVSDHNNITLCVLLKTGEFNFVEMKMIGKYGIRSKVNCSVDNDAILDNHNQ